MEDTPETPSPEWDLGEWERALTINVGTVYTCRDCENLVMVTKGGLGILDLMCCGKPMEKLQAAGAQGSGGAR